VAADALVLDLDTRAGLCTARSLGRAGCRVAIASRDESASGMSTRYATSRTVLPDPAEDFDTHVQALLRLLEQERPDAVLPSIDSSVEALHRNRAAVERFSATGLGDSEAVSIALSKERTIEVARSLGIPVPRSVLVTTQSELTAALAEVGTPCVLKPVTSWRDDGAGGERAAPIFAGDEATAFTVGEAFVRPDAPVLVQELAPGARETIKLFRVDGRTVVRMAIVIDRCWPPLGGSSVMRKTITPSEETLAHAERLAAEVGIDGYSEVEFRRDSAGRPLLMEINPRLSQSVEVAVRAGVDFPRMQFEWARGGTIPPPPAPTLGLRVGWLAGDLRLVVGALGGSPPPRPALGPTLRAIASDYLLQRARVEGLDLHDRRPVRRSIRFAFGRLG